MNLPPKPITQPSFRTEQADISLPGSLLRTGRPAHRNLPRIRPPPRHRWRPQKSRLVLPRRSRPSRRALPPPQRRRPQHHRLRPHAPIPQRTSRPGHPRRPIPRNLPPPPLQRTRPTLWPPRRRPRHPHSESSPRRRFERSEKSLSDSSPTPSLLRHPPYLSPPPPHAHRRRHLLHHPRVSPPRRPRPKYPCLPRRRLLLARPRPPRRPRPSHSRFSATSPSINL